VVVTTGCGDDSLGLGATFCNGSFCQHLVPLAGCAGFNVLLFIRQVVTTVKTDST
jgi:hypothetical protein